MEVTIPSVENKMATEYTVEKITYKWEIRNYSFSGLGPREKIVSPTFFSGGGKSQQLKWNLQCYPQGIREDENPSRFLSIYLCSLSSNASNPIKVKFNISIHDANMKKIKSIGVITPKGRLSTFSNYLAALGYPKFLPSEHLVGLPNDKLLVLCELHVNVEVLEESIFRDKDAKISSSTICDDVSRLLENSNFSDLVIVCRGGREFKCHKTILAARSEVFEAMFMHDFLEKSEGVVSVDDIEDDVMAELLRFIYTDKIEGLQDEQDDFLASLLTAADKYNIKRLKSICEKKLSGRLSVGNLIDLLILADVHNAEELKASALKLMISTSIGDLSQNRSWNLLKKDRSSLLAEAFGVMKTQ